MDKKINVLHGKKFCIKKMKRHEAEVFCGAQKIKKKTSRFQKKYQKKFWRHDLQKVFPFKWNSP